MTSGHHHCYQSHEDGSEGPVELIVAAGNAAQHQSAHFARHSRKELCFADLESLKRQFSFDDVLGRARQLH